LTTSGPAGVCPSLAGWAGGSLSDRNGPSTLLAGAGPRPPRSAIPAGPHVCSRSWSKAMTRSTPARRRPAHHHLRLLRRRASGEAARPRRV